MRKRAGKPTCQKEIAQERIDILFSLAKKAFPVQRERAHRYVELARKIGKRYTLPLGKEKRMRFCRKCGHYLAQGRNARIRTRASQQAIIIACLDCKTIMRFPYRKEKASSKGGKHF